MSFDVDVVLPRIPGLGAFLTLAVQAQYADSLLPILEEEACRTCHHAGGVASAMRLYFPAQHAASRLLEAFGNSLARFVDRVNPQHSPWLTKPTNRVPYVCGGRIRSGSLEERTLKHLVSRLAALSHTELAAPLPIPDRPPPAAGAKSFPVLRRLIRSKYNNLVRDLLGDSTSRPAMKFPAEDFVNSFKN